MRRRARRSRSRIASVRSSCSAISAGSRIVSRACVCARTLSRSRLVLAQVALGIGNVKLGLPLPVATAHNGVAALLLFSLIAAFVRTQASHRDSKGRARSFPSPASGRSAGGDEGTLGRRRSSPSPSPLPHAGEGVTLFRRSQTDPHVRHRQPISRTDQAARRRADRVHRGDRHVPRGARHGAAACR